MKKRTSPSKVPEDIEALKRLVTKYDTSGFVEMKMNTIAQLKKLAGKK